jgi:hypothetical protein
VTARIGVVLFPGTNCEHDIVHATTRLGAEAEILFHDRHDLGGADAVVIPGGFAHGDYLRTGAIARFSAGPFRSRYFSTPVVRDRHTARIYRPLILCIQDTCTVFSVIFSPRYFLLKYK